MSRAIVLISGGLDSCVAATWAAEQFGPENCFPINFAYGQRHSRELVASQQIVERLGLRDPVTFNLQQAFTMIGGSSLTSGKSSGNPSTESVSRTPSDLPPSFVPGRNIIMLAVAASLGYTKQASHIVGGWNAVDYSGYPDCRSEFMESMARALRDGLGLDFSGTRFIAEIGYGDLPPSAGVHIAAPLIKLTKAQIIELGLELNAPLGLSWSCYSGGSVPCGECDSCKIRIDGFKTVGVPDPALVA